MDKMTKNVIAWAEMHIGLLITVIRWMALGDLRWKVVYAYQRRFDEKSYKQIVLQLFVCPKTVYRTISTFLNTADVKPYGLGRPTGSIT
jgi:hypothetical protein